MLVTHVQLRGYRVVTLIIGNQLQNLQLLRAEQHNSENTISSDSKSNDGSHKMQDG